MSATKKLLDDMEHPYEVPQEKPVKQFKISCSVAHMILGQKGLGVTGEKFLKQWYISKKYNRKKDFWAKQVEKGLMVEQTGIEMLSAHLGQELVKNDQWFEDLEIQGIPDVITDDTIIDIKSSWDIFSFPMCEKVLKNSDYDWQLQGYMAITGYEKAAIAYVLINTPKPLIDQELKKLYYQSGGRAEDWQPEDYEHLATNYKFDDVPFHDRIRLFEVKKDESKIKLIRERVALCREYIKENFI